jgi:hypothetical protein
MSGPILYSGAPEQVNELVRVCFCDEHKLGIDVRMLPGDQQGVVILLSQFPATSGIGWKFTGATRDRPARKRPSHRISASRGTPS